MAVRPARASHDPRRGARVVSRTPLLYSAGADGALDRPRHVRAGSALVGLGGGLLAVVQDDAAFFTVIDPRSGKVEGIPFPSTDGVRQFDDVRGNKHDKLDLEAAFVVPKRGLFVALGSGSSPRRERVVVVTAPTTSGAHVTIGECPGLYALLRSETAFAGSELNVEGAVVDGDDIVFFQRGNGAPSSSLQPVDATARLSLEAFFGAIAGRPLPALRTVSPWDLGTAFGARLTFTDGAIAPGGGLAFLACAEDSPDATRDGPVTAVTIGWLDDTTGRAELGLVLDEHGVPLLDKAEGLAFLDDDRRAYLVTDRDVPDAPSELLEVRLGEAW